MNSDLWIIGAIPAAIGLIWLAIDSMACARKKLDENTKIYDSSDDMLFMQ